MTGRTAEAGDREGGVSPFKALGTESESLKSPGYAEEKMLEGKPSSNESVNGFSWVNRDLLGAHRTGFGN